MQITTRCSFIVHPTKQMGCSNFKCKIYLEELQPELLSDWSVWLEVWRSGLWGVDRVAKTGNVCKMVNNGVGWVLQ